MPWRALLPQQGSKGGRRLLSGVSAHSFAGAAVLLSYCLCMPRRESIQDTINSLELPLNLVNFLTSAYGRDQWWVSLAHEGRSPWAFRPRLPLLLRTPSRGVPP